MRSNNMTSSVRKAGFQPFVQRGVSVKPNQTVTLNLSHAQPVRGVVLSPDGRPIAGVEIREYIKDERFGDTTLSGQYGPVLATTDADGRFMLSELDDGATYLLVAESKEYGRKAFSLAPPFQKELSIKFGPFLTVSGIIRGNLDELENENGQPSISFRLATSLAVWKSPYGCVISEPLRSDRSMAKGTLPLENCSLERCAIRAGKHIVRVKVSESEPNRQVTIDLRQAARQRSSDKSCCDSPRLPVHPHPEGRFTSTRSQTIKTATC